MELDARLALHSDIDAHFDERLAQLESERADMHASLDRLWPFLCKLPGGPSLAAVIQADQPSTQSAVQVTPQASSPNGSAGQKRKPFALRRAISEIVDGLEVGAEISQPDIYTKLLETYVELREQRPPNFRAQIASVLNWLANDEKRLRIAKEGRGNNPHVYKKLSAIERDLELAFGGSTEQEIGEGKS